MKPDCYTCKHRGTLTGSCHSRCLHPKVTFMHTPTARLMAHFMEVTRGGQSGKLEYLDVQDCNPLGITGDPHGIRNQWFWWPWNFDPVWLESCNGYEATS